MSKSKHKSFLFLIIDDETPYVEALHRDAQMLGIRFKHYTNLEEARQFIESKDGKAVSGIVLDVKCMREKQQEVAHIDFIGSAVQYFKKTFSHLPIAILTGEPDQYKNLKEIYRDTISVYSKGSEESQMFTYLIGKAKDLPDSKIREKHFEVFETIDKYFDPDVSSGLLHCIRSMENQDSVSITRTLGNLRKLQEYFYLALHKLDNNMVPGNFLKFKDKTSVDNKNIIEHLKGNFDKRTMTTTTPVYIKHTSKEDRLFYYVHKGCSEEIHVSDQYTTKYTVQSLVFAFMDLVLWLKAVANFKK
jgi:hypothetical protein